MIHYRRSKRFGGGLGTDLKTCIIVDMSSLFFYAKGVRKTEKVSEEQSLELFAQTL